MVSQAARRVSVVADAKRALFCVADRCSYRATKGTLRVPLCETHYDELGHTIILDWELEQGARKAAAHHRREVAKEQVCTVYYFERWDGFVKIGYTSDLARRREQLEEEHGELELLATEVGARLKEKQRHEEFAHLRQGRTEWFAVDEELMRHIDRCSRAHAERT